MTGRVREKVIKINCIHISKQYEWINSIKKKKFKISVKNLKQVHSLKSSHFSFLFKGNNFRCKYFRSSL